MSHCHYDKFLQKGGKCPKLILTNFQKWRKMSTSGLTRYQKKEENVHRLFLQVFTKRRKMSNGHSDIISQKGVKCPSVILAIFKNHLDSWEEKISLETMFGRIKSGVKKVPGESFCDSMFFMEENVLG